MPAIGLNSEQRIHNFYFSTATKVIVEMTMVYWDYLPEDMQDMAMTAIMGGEIDLPPGIAKIMGVVDDTIIVEPQPGPLFPPEPLPPTKCPTEPGSKFIFRNKWPFV